MGTTKGKKRVTFLMNAPDAMEVAVCGDFNDWEIEKHPMQKIEDGRWRKIMMLAPGRYEYKFYVGTEWRCDPTNRSRCANMFGTANSVIFVEP